MKHILHHTILAAGVMAAGCALPATAQQLSKEITIEREIVPEVRAASRLELFPRTLSFAPQKGTLQFSDYTEATSINPGISPLGAARTEAAIALTPYRGYVDASYFPTATVGVSAGYSIIDNNRTHLNVWGQFDNNSYNGRPLSYCDKTTYSRLGGSLGVDFATRIAQAGELSLATAVKYHRFSNLDRLLLEADPDFTDATDIRKWQGTLEWTANAGWEGWNSTGLRYHAGVNFGLMNFTSPTASGIRALHNGPEQTFEFKPVHEKRFGASFGAAQTIGNAQQAGVEIAADFLNINHYRTIADLQTLNMVDGGETSVAALKNLADAGSRTFGLVSLSPYYRYAPQGGVVSLKAGVRLDFSIHSSKAVHVAPDVLLGVNPASGFGAWLKIDGGEQLNTISRLADFTPFISPLMGYGMSNVPVKGEFGLRFGPFKGAAVTLDVAYAAANNWLMPAWEAGARQIVFQADKLRSWKAGVHVMWNYRSAVALEAGFETLLDGGYSHAWLDWTDRSRTRLTASVTIRPVEPLTIDLGYTMGLHRRMTVLPSDAEAISYVSDMNLKNRHRVNVGASYSISQPLTVFVRVENLLNRNEFDAISVASQGITGAIGVGYKF